MTMELVLDGGLGAVSGGATARWGVTASQGEPAAESRASTVRISSGRASSSERDWEVTLSEYQLAHGCATAIRNSLWVSLDGYVAGFARDACEHFHHTKHSHFVPGCSS